MKVKNWMTSNPITVKPNTPVMEASRLMKEHGIRRLPVVKGDKVVGIVTQRNLLEAAPSAATTLSVHELNYILANLEVSQVMRKNPVCVSPDDSVIDVMIMGQEKGIGSFPVVDNGRLVGIATETEIFRAMMHLFGGKEKGDDFVVLANVRLRERGGGHEPHLQHHRRAGCAGDFHVLSATPPLRGQPALYPGAYRQAGRG
jgi:acetoin utilization protein AcuB